MRPPADAQASTLNVHRALVRPSRTPETYRFGGMKRGTLRTRSEYRSLFSIGVLAVARRSSPDRVYTARRAAVLSRLTQERRLSAERAEALVAAWEVEGDSRGLERMTAGFWDDGTTWIEEQLGA